MSQFTITLENQGQSRIRHDLAGTEILTDRPPEYGGQGRSFSATDLVCAALGTCILTTMEQILAREGHDPQKLVMSVQKTLSDHPKMIRAIHLDITYPDPLDDLLKKKLTRAMAACPVKRSLSSQVDINTRFADGSSA